LDAVVDALVGAVGAAAVGAAVVAAAVEGGAARVAAAPAAACLSGREGPVYPVPKEGACGKVNGSGPPWTAAAVSAAAAAVVAKLPAGC